MSKENIGALGTESRNPRTMNLDKMSSLEMVEAIVNEEKRVAPAVLAAKEQMAKAVDLFTEAIQNPNARIIESGSGCSGDYCCTDVLELPATFGEIAFTETPFKDKVMALHIQRGWMGDTRDKAWRDWYAKDMDERDDSEDSSTQPIKDLETANFGKDDLLILITASGRSPVIVNMAREAKRRGGKVIAIVMNKNTAVSEFADVTVEAVIGQPPLTGSGRTVAGSASKVAITTLSTAAYARAGAVYSNLMVNLNVKKWLDNSKFIDRATRIVQDITGQNKDDARKYLEDSDWNIKRAIVMFKKGLSKDEAEKLLTQSKGVLRAVIG